MAGIDIFRQIWYNISINALSTRIRSLRAIMDRQDEFGKNSAGRGFCFAPFFVYGLL